MYIHVTAMTLLAWLIGPEKSKGILETEGEWFILNEKGTANVVAALSRSRASAGF
jgi:hypothetical protein